MPMVVKCTLVMALKLTLPFHTKLTPINLTYYAIKMLKELDI